MADAHSETMGSVFRARYSCAFSSVLYRASASKTSNEQRGVSLTGPGDRRAGRLSKVLVGLVGREPSIGPQRTHGGVRGVPGLLPTHRRMDSGLQQAFRISGLQLGELQHLTT